jgi:PAS domain S-box-containing protein
MREITVRNQKSNPDVLQGYKDSYHALTELMPLGAFRLGPGPEYAVLFANQALARMLGYESADAIVGISARDIINNPVHWQQIEKDLVNNKTVSRRELQLRHKEGSEILVALNARTTPASGLQIAGIDGIAEDITEQKVLEMEMQYYNAELKRYASSLAQANKKLNVMNQITRHDILNTITGLFGYVDMAEATDSPEEKEKLLNGIRNLTQIMQRQIVFTKEYQEVGVHLPQWQNVRKLIETVTTPLSLPKGTLVIRIENLSIYADLLLEKVFYNLVENALRHGKGVTRITFSSVPQENNIIIVCEDNGNGIPEKYKDAIFKRQHFNHTGFGLFLSRESLDITGLTIRETGEPGKGARFEITVPPEYFRITDQTG